MRFTCGDLLGELVALRRRVGDGVDSREPPPEDKSLLCGWVVRLITGGSSIWYTDVHFSARAFFIVMD